MKRTAAADPHTFSGPLAPPRFSAMPNASFSACFTFVTSDPKTKYNTHKAHPRQPKVDHNATPNAQACNNPDDVNQRCFTAIPKMASAELVQSPVPTLAEYAANSGRLMRAKRESARRSPDSKPVDVLEVSAQMLVVVVGLLVKERTVEGKAPVGRTEERKLETFLHRQPRGPLRKAPVVENAVACCTGRSMRTTQGSSARSSIGCMCRNFILRAWKQQRKSERDAAWDGDGGVVEDADAGLGPRYATRYLWKLVL